MKRSLQYDHIVATGGIGSGIFFELVGNETLGREESRMAKLLPYKDYCKQHIILHYISTLLGAGKKGFQCFAIGAVGDDDAGRMLIRQMDTAGINTECVKVMRDESTLFSVCYLYPDHSGGNITTATSASSKVSADDIDQFFAKFQLAGREIVLAAPEVPVPARIRLLEHGRRRNSLTVSSVASGEIAEFDSRKGFELTDMLFINLDEARSIAAASEHSSAEKIVLSVTTTVIKQNPSMTVFVTCGAQGVYCYQKNHFEFFEATSVDVVSTAGAGDAFLAGTVAGICMGLPLFKFKDPGTYTAVDAGIRVAAASITSPHTINEAINESIL